VERFNFRKLSDLEVGKQNLNKSEKINRASENIKENIKTSAKQSRSV